MRRRSCCDTLLTTIEHREPQFERLIEQHRAQLHGFLLSLVGNLADSEDLLQQVCLILWQKREQFEAGSNFLAWARQIARFQVLNHWRKSSNQRCEPLLDEHMVETVYEVNESREQEFAEYQGLLSACIEQLPSRQRGAVHSHYMLGHSIPQIATEFGIKENAASQLLFRARSSLITCVQSKLKKSNLTES